MSKVMSKVNSLRKKSEKKSLSIIISITIGIFFSCSAPFDLDNPVDPKSDNYQGYQVVESVDEIGADFPVGGKQSFPVFWVSEVLTEKSYLYDYQVDSEDQFSSPLLAKSDVEGNIVSFYGIDISEGQLFWRFRVHEAQESLDREWSEAIAFTATSGIKEREIQPSNKAEFRYNEIPEMIEWNDISLADSYQLEIKKNSVSFDLTDRVEDVTKSEFSVGDGISVRDKLYWRVRPVDSEGRVGYWSDTYQYTVSPVVFEDGFEGKDLSDNWEETNAGGLQISDENSYKGDSSLFFEGNDDRGIELDIYCPQKCTLSFAAKGNLQNDAFSVRNRNGNLFEILDEDDDLSDWRDYTHDLNEGNYTLWFWYDNRSDWPEYEKIWLDEVRIEIK